MGQRERNFRANFYIITRLGTPAEYLPESQVARILELVGTQAALQEQSAMERRTQSKETNQIESIQHVN
jgi:hypothetical protein